MNVGISIFAVAAVVILYIIVKRVTATREAKKPIAPGADRTFPDPDDR